MQALQRQLSGLEASTSGRDAGVWRPFSAAAPRSRQITRHRKFACFAAAAPKKDKPERQQAIQTQQLTLPASEFARIKKAAYVSSSVDLKGCPPQSLPEFAVIGRSNVGKSSLINMLTQSSKLAKVSKQPGKSITATEWHAAAVTRRQRCTGGDQPVLPLCLSCAAGMTKSINHFLINDSWYLVDLPGYG
jgi:hypothetical protein